jgi:hypothetical protein
MARSAAQGAQTGRDGPASGTLSGQYPRPRRPRPEGATFDAVLPQVDSFRRSRARRRRYAGQPLHWVGDGGRAIAAFARKAGIPFHAVPAPGKPTAEAPHLHINNVNAYHSRLKQWRPRFNGVATKNLPNDLGWRRALEAWGHQLAPPIWIRSAIDSSRRQ